MSVRLHLISQARLQTQLQTHDWEASVCLICLWSRVLAAVQAVQPCLGLVGPCKVYHCML